LLPWTWNPGSEKKWHWLWPSSRKRCGAAELKREKISRNRCKRQRKRILKNPNVKVCGSCVEYERKFGREEISRFCRLPCLSEGRTPRLWLVEKKKAWWPPTCSQAFGELQWNLRFAPLITPSIEIRESPRSAMVTTRSIWSPGSAEQIRRAHNWIQGSAKNRERKWK
jgi:hypothetical protein